MELHTSRGRNLPILPVASTSLVTCTQAAAGGIRCPAGVMHLHSWINYVPGPSRRTTRERPTYERPCVNQALFGVPQK